MTALVAAAIWVASSVIGVVVWARVMARPQTPERPDVVAEAEAIVDAYAHAHVHELRQIAARRNHPAWRWDNEGGHR